MGRVQAGRVQAGPGLAARGRVVLARDGSVAARRDLADSLVATGIPHLGKAKEHPRFRQELSAVMAKVGNVRRLGAAAIDLAYVAAGRYDAYWERGLQSWDMAAGIVLVREAGGFVSDLAGGSDPLARGDILVGNETMVRGLSDLLRPA